MGSETVSLELDKIELIVGLEVEVSEGSRACTWVVLWRSMRLRLPRTVVVNGCVY